MVYFQAGFACDELLVPHSYSLCFVTTPLSNVIMRLLLVLQYT